MRERIETTDPATWFAHAKTRTKMILSQGGGVRFVYHLQRTARRNANGKVIGFDQHWKLLGEVGKITPDEEVAEALNITTELTRLGG